MADAPDLDDDDVARNGQEASPPYGQFFPALSFTDEGRIDVPVGARLSRNLEWLVNSQPAEEPQTTEAPSSIPRPPWDIKLNIVVQVVGSRGDVQPFVALGNELQRYGHRVRLATHATFERFVTSAGLEFYPIGGDPVELMSYMVRNPGLIPSLGSLRAGDIQRKRAMISEILHGGWQSCIEPDPGSRAPFVADAIIANPPSFAHVHCAQALGIPIHLMFTMPWTSTREFHHPLANLKYSGTDASLGNLISYHFVEWMTWQGLGDLINTWRRDALDLESITTTEGPSLAETLNVPFTYCWSPALVPKPSDWGPHIDVCGFFFRDPPAYEPSPDLDAFLRAGAPPVYIGFGSIVLEDGDSVVAILLCAIRKAGVRAVISCGWGGLHGQELPDVFYLGDCPHEWLFQHVAAVVHHGGAGTTACGLLHGRPTAIIPFFGDQPFWGNMVAAAAAGPTPIPRKALTVESLADAITYCLTPQAAAAARDIAVKMKRERGVEAAVGSFHANLPRHNMECDLVPGHPAVWVFEKGRRRIKLSKVASWILTHRGRMQEKHLRRHETKPMVIDIRRWDPLTAVSSASLSTISGMADATAGMFLDPYREYKFHRSERCQDSASSRSPTSEAPTTRTQSSPVTEDADHVKQMALASAISLGRFIGRSSRGALVDLPLAAAEGMRAVPRLYGEDVESHGKVTGWKSGVLVACSTFTRGLYQGTTDIFVYTYHGKKEQGAVGVAKGLTKGLVSLTVKTGASTVGLVAYPNQGIYRSLRRAVKRTPAKKIEQSRWAEAESAMRTDEGLRMDVEQVCRSFDAFLARNK